MTTFDPTAWRAISGIYPPDEFCPIPHCQAHCDSRILHEPGVCIYCDHYPELQQWRIDNGWAFTGETPLPHQRPCPADAARPPNSPSDHRRWGGNKPTSAEGDAAWPAESFASVVMYGDKGGRQLWPLTERITRTVKARTTSRLSYWLRGFEQGDGLLFYPAREMSTAQRVCSRWYRAWTGRPPS